MKYEYICKYKDANGNDHEVMATLTKDPPPSGLGEIELYVDGIRQILRNSRMCYMYGLDSVVVAKLKDKNGLYMNDYRHITDQSYKEYNDEGDVIDDYGAYLS